MNCHVPNPLKGTAHTRCYVFVSQSVSIVYIHYHALHNNRRLPRYITIHGFQRHGTIMLASLYNYILLNLKPHSRLTYNGLFCLWFVMNWDCFNLTYKTL